MAGANSLQKFPGMNFRDELPPIIQFANPDLYLYLSFWISVEL